MITWNELVAIGLIGLLKDTELVIYFMKIIKSLRRDFVENEAREWHKSLRITQEDKWKRVYELSQKGKYNEMNADVPITCTLPFDGGMWRNSRLLLRSIRYFRKGFIKCPSWMDELEEFALSRYYHGPAPPDEMEIPQKIKIVNIMIGDTEKSRALRGSWGIPEIQEALEDFILFEEDLEAERSDDELSDDEGDEAGPYLLIEKVSRFFEGGGGCGIGEGQIMTIIG